MLAPIRTLPGFGVAHVTLEAVIISCDEGYASFLGITREDAVGRRVADFTDDVGGGSPDAMNSILVRTGEPMSVRRTYVQPDGAKVPCIVQLCLIRDAQGLPHSIVGVAQLVSSAP